MKLLKKLLPIASVATIGATIAPMVASCGAYNVDLLTYKAKFEPIASDSYSIAKANSELLKSEKIDVIKDDALLTIQDESAPSSGKINSFKAYVKNLSVEKTSKDSVDYYLVSYSYGYTYNVDDYNVEAQSRSAGNVEIKVDVKNIPFTFTPTGSIKQGNWLTTYFDSYQKLNKTLLTSLNQNWSISISEKENLTITSYAFNEVIGQTVQKSEYKNEYNKDYTGDILMWNIATYISLRSFYFDNITIS